MGRWLLRRGLGMRAYWTSAAASHGYGRIQGYVCTRTSTGVNSAVGSRGLVFFYCCAHVGRQPRGRHPRLPPRSAKSVSAAARPPHSRSPSASSATVTLRSCHRLALRARRSHLWKLVRSGWTQAPKGSRRHSSRRLSLALYRRRSLWSLAASSFPIAGPPSRPTVTATGCASPASDASSSADDMPT